MSEAACCKSASLEMALIVPPTFKWGRRNTYRSRRERVTYVETTEGNLTKEGKKEGWRNNVGGILVR